MRILVTGCAGFIGSHLTTKLINNNCAVTGIDNLNDYYSIAQKKYNLGILSNLKNFTFIHADVNKINTFNGKFDSVVHLAAHPGVTPSMQDPWKYIDNNIKNLASVLEWSVCHNIKNFIFASSSSVYGVQDTVPFAENAITNPVSVYGQTKLAGEVLCRVYTHNYALPVTSLRFFTCYGPAQRPDLAIHKFVRAIINNQEITVFNNGEVSRDFTYIDDITEGICRCIDRNVKNETINLGNSHPVKVLDMIRALEKVLGKSANIRFADLPRSDPHTTYANIEKANSILSWHPTTSLEYGLMHFVDWYYSFYEDQQ